MATLNELAKQVRNTTSRNAQAFLRTEALDKDGTSYDIASVVDSNTFNISSDVTGDSEFAAGELIYVDDSSADGNNTVFTVASTDLDGSGGTDITVEETISETSPSTLGTIYVAKDYVWVNVGRFMNANFSSEPITSSADQDGRESSQLFDITVTLALMQTSNEELSLLDELAMPDTQDYGFYLNGHTMYFSGSNQITTSEVNDATDNATGAITFGTNSGELDDPDGLQFENILLKPSPDIDLSGEESSIALEFTGIIELGELTDLESTQTILISAE